LKLWHELEGLCQDLDGGGIELGQEVMEKEFRRIALTVAYAAANFSEF
jgi:hypothetical protein